MKTIRDLVVDNFHIKIISMALACTLVFYKTCADSESKTEVVDETTKELTE